MPSSSESDLLSLSTLDIEDSEMTEGAGDMGGEGEGESCWQVDVEDMLEQRGTVLKQVAASSVVILQCMNVCRRDRKGRRRLIIEKWTVRVGDK